MLEFSIGFVAGGLFAVVVTALLTSTRKSKMDAEDFEREQNWD
jgi:hypothetical protein